MDHRQLKIALCDDDAVLLDALEALTRSILDGEGIDYSTERFSSAAGLLKVLQADKNHFSLLLLDIMMEGLDGLGLAAWLREAGGDAMIVLISSNKELALHGYEVDAARYLAKPLDRAKLREALLYCQKQLCRRKELLVQVESGFRRVAPDEIRYIEVAGRGTSLVLNGESLRSHVKISDYAAQLSGHHFVRCHQGYLVNLKYVDGVTRYELTLAGGIRLPVSKQRFLGTRQALLAYLTE